MFDTLEAKGENVDDLLAVQKELHPNEDEAYWREETVANTVPVILTDVRTGIEFAERVAGESEQTRSVFIRMLNKIRSFLNKAYNILKGEKSWRQMESIRGDLDAIAEIRRAYFAALEELTPTQEQSEQAPRFSLGEYTDEQKRDWANSKRIVLYKNSEQLGRFIDDAIADNKFNKRVYFGKVSKELAAQIKKATGINTLNYNLSLGGSEIRKILKDHGSGATESPRGQRAITKTDFVNIPEVVTSPDKITLSKNQYSGMPVIEFEKMLDGRTTIVSYVSDGSHSLLIQTMYSGKNNRNLARPTDERASVNTPKASTGTVPIESVSRPDSSVNTSIRKTGEGDTPKFSLKDPVYPVYPQMRRVPDE